MAQQPFTVDDSDLRAFSKELQFQRPSQVSAIVRTVLNDQAFATRANAQRQTIPKFFINRSTWVASSILMDRAQGRDTRKMQSEVGAKKRWRRNPSEDFKGMAEQEFGATIRSPDISTTTSRSGGVFSGRVRPTLRYNRLGPAVTLPSGNREIGMLRQLDRQKYKGAIRAKNSRRFRKGFYKFTAKRFTTPRGEKVRKMQLVKDLSKSSARVQKRPWLRTATDNAVNAQTVARFYRRAFERFTKARPR